MHEVPVAQWPRELNLKLKGTAANWYVARFPGTLPPWRELYAAMLLAYKQSYGAAASSVCPALPAKKPMHEWKSVRCFFGANGLPTVTNPGQEEQYEYILENHLPVGESACWISSATIGSARP